MALPLDLRDLMKSSTRYSEEREKPVRLAVLVDAEAPQATVDVIREALVPLSGKALLRVEAVVPGDVLAVDSSADAVVAVAGPGTALAPSLMGTRQAALPTVVLAQGTSQQEVALRLTHPLLDTIVREEAEDLVEPLGRWLGERVPGKRVALAANFAFVRRAVAEEAVKSTSFQNAVIGGVMVIPGADMPIMTANQAKMVMQIAAAYGVPLGAERVKELATVVGSAFALRAIARQFVGLVPGFGWAIKAGIGYSGTLAMGYAAIEYFEAGGDVRGLADKLKEARDSAVAAAGRRRGRGGRTEVIPAHARIVGEDGADQSPVEGSGSHAIPAVAGPQVQLPPVESR